MLEVAVYGGVEHGGKLCRGEEERGLGPLRSSAWELDFDLLEVYRHAGYVCGVEDEPNRVRALDSAVLVRLGAGGLDDGFVAASHHGPQALRRGVCVEHPIGFPQ